MSETGLQKQEKKHGAKMGEKMLEKNIQEYLSEIKMTRINWASHLQSKTKE